MTEICTEQFRNGNEFVRAPKRKKSIRKRSLRDCHSPKPLSSVWWYPLVRHSRIPLSVEKGIFESRTK